LRREVAAGYPQHYCTFAELTAQEAQIRRLI
jgi:hypothetical protein